MLPTLNSNVENSDQLGDTVYVSPYAKIQLNDIVIASPDWASLSGNLIIKRLVGMPGDKIQIKDLGDSYGLFVNDSLLYSKDKYIDGELDYSGTYSYYKKYLDFLKTKSEYVETENEEYFIKLDKNEYFLMGDNWGYTLDSLYEKPVSRKDIVGKTQLVVDYKNKDRLFVVKYILKQIFSFN